jgi:hypothetical protein
MNLSKQNGILLFLTIVCIVSRVPQLVSDKLLLDGDECVVAIMAKHMLSLHEFPLFFYGQTYGFSLIECLFIIPFYLLGGITALSVKCGMIALWTTGVLLLYKALDTINKGPWWVPLLFTLVFICSPAWAVWSMKARGGYLTAFTLSALVLLLLFRDKKNYLTFVIAGTLCSLIAQSQRLWLPGLLPFVAYYLLKDKKVLPLSLFTASAILPGVIFHFYKKSIVEFGGVPVYYPSKDILVQLQRIPAFLYYSLHGNYFFADIQKPNLFCVIFAILFAGLILLLPVFAIYNIVTRKKGSLLFNLSALSVLLTLLTSVFTYMIQPRYLLPVTGYTIISVTLLLNTIDINVKALQASAFGLTGIGIVSVITFYNFDFSPVRETSLHNALNYLAKRGIHYAYCTDNLLTWQVIFYSNEQIVCREQQLPGRYGRYLHEVDSAFYNGAKSAFILHSAGYRAIEFANYTTIDDFLIIVDPPKEKIAANFPLLKQTN